MISQNWLIPYTASSNNIHKQNSLMQQKSNVPNYSIGTQLVSQIDKMQPTLVFSTKSDS